MSLDRQLGFSSSHHLVVEKNLDTGEIKLKRKKRSRKERILPPERARVVNQWWNELGRQRFIKTAQAWAFGESAQLAEDTNQSVEYTSAQMVITNAEGELRKAIRATRFKPIGALDIVAKFRSEAIDIRARGSQFRWIDNFLLWTVDIVSEEFRLTEEKKVALRVFAHQPRLSGF